MPNSKWNPEIRRMEISALHPADYNPRTISDRAFSGLSASMDRFGVLSHIVWNKRTGNIVGGHQRYRHLVECGEKYADVVVVDLDDNEEVALNITLNNPHVRGDFTTEIMAQLRECEEWSDGFGELCMNDLYDILKKKGYEKNEKKEKKKVSEEEGGDEAPDAGEDDSKPKEDGPSSFAVIRCPECGSKWRMDDNLVVFNGIVQSEEGMEMVLEENGKI